MGLPQPVRVARLTEEMLNERLTLQGATDVLKC
jgi:hypothetical protein